MIGRRICALTAALVFAVPVVAVFSAPIAWPLRLMCGAVLLVTLSSPFSGLLILLGILPLCTYVWAMVDPPSSSFGTPEVGEMLLGPFLCAASLRFGLRARPADGWLTAPALVLGAVVATSGAFVLCSFEIVTWWPDTIGHDLWRHLLDSYYSDRSMFQPLHLPMAWIEGLAVALTAERLTRENRAAWPSLVRMFAAGAAAAAIPSCLRLVEISVFKPHPLSVAFNYLRTLRLTAILQDVNAVGALLALYLVPVIWLACHRRRWWWCWPIAAALLLSLWLTGSRGALLAAMISLAALWLLARRKGTTRVAIVATLMTAMFALTAWDQGRQAQSSSSLALSVRLAMAKVGLHVAAEDPVFGVGFGQFSRISRHFISPALVTLFPQANTGENAHNNFIQILAELGVCGFGAFLWLLAAFARSTSREAPVRTPLDVVQDDLSAARRGFTGGIAAFLLSCLVSHPLLVIDVLWLFLLPLGVATGWSCAPSARSVLWSRRIAVAAVILLIAMLPIRLWRFRHTAILDGAIIGVHAETQTLDGVSYRLTDARSGWFVPRATQFVEIPLRATSESPTSCHVQIDVDGHAANTVQASTSNWSKVLVPLASTSQSPRSRQLQLRTETNECHLMVGELVLRN